MGRIRVSLLALAMGSVAIVVGVVPLNAGAVTPPSIAAVPSTNVADGQVISVTGSGFSPSASVAVIECQTGATSESGCDLSTYITVTASTGGSFSTPFIASRFIHPGGGTTSLDCAVSGACFLGAANIADLSEGASTPLSFNPTAPTPPPLAIGGTLSPTGTVGKKTGVATLSGTVTCNRPAYISVNGELSQVYHRFIFSSYFFFSVLCTSSNTWTAVVQPTNGLFGKGAASVDATAFGSVGGTSSQVNLSGPVTLQFPKN
jgi:hypothetical protein